MSIRKALSVTRVPRFLVQCRVGPFGIERDGNEFIFQSIAADHETHDKTYAQLTHACLIII